MITIQKAKQERIQKSNVTITEDKVMKFSRKKFERNADKGALRLVPKEHRAALDGKEVVNGEIEYKVGNDKFCLYPVFLEWCEE